MGVSVISSKTSVLFIKKTPFQPRFPMIHAQLEVSEGQCGGDYLTTIPDATSFPIDNITTPTSNLSLAVLKERKME